MKYLTDIQFSEYFSFTYPGKELINPGYRVGISYCKGIKFSEVNTESKFITIGFLNEKNKGREGAIWVSNKPFRQVF